MVQLSPCLAIYQAGYTCVDCVDLAFVRVFVSSIWIGGWCYSAVMDPVGDDAIAAVFATLGSWESRVPSGTFDQKNGGRVQLFQGIRCHHHHVIGAANRRDPVSVSKVLHVEHVGRSLVKFRKSPTCFNYETNSAARNPGIPESRNRRYNGHLVFKCVN